MRKESYYQDLFEKYGAIDSRQITKKTREETTGNTRPTEAGKEETTNTSGEGKDQTESANRVSRDVGQ